MPDIDCRTSRDNHASLPGGSFQAVAHARTKSFGRVANVAGGFWFSTCDVVLSRRFESRRSISRSLLPASCVFRTRKPITLANSATRNANGFKDTGARKPVRVVLSGWIPVALGSTSGFDFVSCADTLITKVACCSQLGRGDR